MKQYLLGIIVILFVTVGQASAQTIFINEIHYDNASTDTGEAVEIAGPAGTDLTGWSIVLYNGNGGSSYKTSSLSGTVPNLTNGSGVLDYPISSIQNGAPDGVALVDASNVVVQFLSYEGKFSAVGGPADGMTSTDIEVTEDSSTPEGYSIQLSGTGIEYADFAWQATSENTFGSVNSGQEFSGSGSLALVINEFVFNHTATDVNEFVEVKSSADTDLSEYTLIEIEGDDTGAGVIDKVIQLSTTDATGYWTSGMLSNAFENGTLTLLLVKNFTGSEGEDLDANNDGVLDTLRWDETADDIAVTDGGASDFIYSSFVLEPSFDGGNDTVGGASRIPNGTDTGSPSDWVRNDYEGQGLPDFPDAAAENGEAINTPGAENEIAVVIEDIDLVINEVDADTPGTDYEEFIELYDGGKGNLSLTGYVVVLYNGNGDISYASYDLNGYSTNAEGYFVLGNSSVSNADITINNNSIQNGADAIALYKADVSNFSNGTTVTTENLVDALVYDTNDDDDAGLLILLNEGEAQINEDMSGDKDNLSMQRIPNGEGGERNTSAYTTSDPSPGTENGVVLPPPAVISIAKARATSDETVVTVSGILTVSDQFAGSAYLQDQTAGIAVFDAQVHGEGLFEIGDSITISGTRSTYNGQVQISPVSAVTSHGLSIHPIEPQVINISEMPDYPGQLVIIANATFPSPGDMIFGNSNIVVTDNYGSGEMRIDADADDLVGLAQPETCDRITGVVSRYNDLFQLLPRIGTDLPCAEKYKQTGDDLDISKDLTLDFVTWNLEWFGDESNSPAAGNINSDAIQKDSVITVLNALDADIYAVEEIADEALFAQMVNELPGYNYILSDATSYPNGAGVKQKVGFIYKTSTVSVIATKVLLKSIHPYYNGGDDSALNNYPGGDATRFYASGRLPFMMIARITLNGITKQYHIIDIHARANDNSSAELKYEMRKYDIDVLKDSLDTYYPDDNLILLGDYNDDVDETVANVTTTTSTYESFTNDPDDYTVVTEELSAEGYRSYVFAYDMIDHIMLSNELADEYINKTARVHYEFYDSDYAQTVSDHLPVSARLQINKLELVSISGTDVNCSGNTDGTTTIEVRGGIPPYAYSWSNGQTTATATDLAAGIYHVTVTDQLGTEVSTEIELTEPEPLELTLVDNKTVYPAYSDSSCATLAITEVKGGSGNYSYLWSTGETNESIEVCPDEKTPYTLTVTDENDCSVEQTVTVTPIDISCGNNYFMGMKKIEVCFHDHTQCVPVRAAKNLLARGAVLGSCNGSSHEPPMIFQLSVFPNPFISNLSVSIMSNCETNAVIDIYSLRKVKMYSKTIQLNQGYNKIDLNLSSLRKGIYILHISGNELEQKSISIIKK